GRFNGTPMVEASIRRTIGKAYKDLGLYPDAERQADRALDLRRRALGSAHPDTLVTMGEMAALYESEGKYVQAEQLESKVWDVRSEERRVGKECRYGWAAYE